MAQLQVSSPPAQPVPGAVPVPVTVSVPVAVPVAPAPFTGTSLYVGELDHNVQEEHLLEHFNSAGQVLSVRVCRDLMTKRSLGYGYVNYATAEDAGHALETLNFSSLNGKPIRVMFSHRDPSIRKSGTGNIYIKNLAKGIDNKFLHETFSAFGNILSCKVALDGNAQSKGFGFVQFEQEDSAQQAIENMNGIELQGKQLYVCHFVRRQERPSPQSTKFNNVYVKNLTNSTTDDDLKSIFGEYGKIGSAVVMRHPDGSSKNFGFVSFENPDDAAKAVEGLNGKVFDDKVWYVGRAQKKSERAEELRAKFDQGGGRYPGVNLYLKNLDDNVDDEKLKEVFQAFGTISSCKIMRDSQGHSKGSGFVAFETAEEANRARIEMNGKPIGTSSKPIYVALAQKREERRRMNAQAHYAGFRFPMGLAGPAVASNIPIFHPGTVFYGQHPPTFPPQAAGFAYQPQLMPGMRPGVQQLPFYALPVLQRPQPQQRPTGRRLPQQTQPLTNQQAQQRPGGRGLRYTPTTRNTADAAAAPALPLDVGVSDVPSLASLLAKAPIEQQRGMLGEHLFPLVEKLEPDFAGKVTGMLLEMDQTEVLHLIESPEDLNLKVEEALEVLRSATLSPEMASLSVSDA